MNKSLVVALLLAASTSALAQPAPTPPPPQGTPPAGGTDADKKAEAKAHYEKGLSHYNLGEWDQAIAEFRAAYAISSAPGLLFNIAQSFRLKKDYDLAILTNGAPELQWSKIHKSGVEDLFDSVTVSGDYSIGKPRKEIFEVVMAKHPGAAGFVMIGNSLTSDIRGARNAGLPCVWFEQGDEPKDVAVKPDAVIRSLSELPDALASLKL